MTTPVPIAAVISSYETLRRIAVGTPAPIDGPGLGFTLLLRQGMAAWLKAWALGSAPRVVTVSAPVAVPLTAVPSLVQHELAQVWAHIVWLQQEAAWK